MKNNLTYLGLIALLVIVIVFGALYSIDLKNMEEGRPVFFSTWGKKYSPVEDGDAVKIRNAIHDYIVSGEDGTEKNANETWFCADKIYLISKEDDLFTTYSWIYAASYINRYNGELLENNSFSRPYRFIIKKTDDIYEVVEVTTPRVGALYEQDLKLFFPEKIVGDILKAESDGTVESLQLDIQNQVAEFHN